jgi:hypothetical protein
MRLKAPDFDMDPICRSPYRPAALRKCRTKGLTEDRTQSRAQTLASRTATTEVLGPFMSFDTKGGEPTFAARASHPSRWVGS